MTYNALMARSDNNKNKSKLLERLLEDIKKAAKEGCYSMSWPYYLGFYQENIDEIKGLGFEIDTRDWYINW